VYDISTYNYLYLHIVLSIYFRVHNLMMATWGPKHVVVNSIPLCYLIKYLVVLMTVDHTYSYIVVDTQRGCCTLKLALYIFILFIPLCHWFMALYKLAVVGLATDKEEYRLMLCDAVYFCETSSTFQRDFGKFRPVCWALRSKELRYHHYENPLLSRWWNFAHNTKELRDRL
jgi:hypothetical protein